MKHLLTICLVAVGISLSFLIAGLGDWAFDKYYDKYVAPKVGYTYKYKERYWKDWQHTTRVTSVSSNQVTFVVVSAYQTNWIGDTWTMTESEALRCYKRIK